MTHASLSLLLAAALAGTLLLSCALTALVVPLARRIGWLDRPGAHKSHTAAVPYGGGVAIFLAAWVPLLAVVLLLKVVSAGELSQLLGDGFRPYLGGLQQRSGQALVILLGGAILHALGIVDDVRPLAAVPKLLVILGVSLLVTLYGRLLVGLMWGTTISTILTVAWFVIIINAFNFLDNMDGLSAGVAWICLLFFGVCGLMAGQVFVPALAAVFAGAILGFWFFNFPPARLFMGDAGSLVVGYMLAVVSVMTTYYQSGAGAPPYALAMPLVVLAIPLYDFLTVVTIRIAEGRNPMRGDQRHFSHRLVDRGLSRRQAVLTIYLATATTGLAATLLPDADLRQTVTVAVIVFMVLSIVAILESPLRKNA